MRTTRPTHATLPVLLAAALVAGAAGCAKDATYHLNGRVIGLHGSGLVLSNGLGPDLAVASDGAFAFEGRWKAGTPFTVAVASQPTAPAQTCTVEAAHATVTEGDELLTVTCVTDRYALGGTVSGLAGQGLVLQNDGVDDLAVAADGTFTFAGPVASGAAYAVTVKVQPAGPAQTCTVAGGSGTVVAGAIATVAVSCATEDFPVGGTVTGLLGTGLVLADGDGHALPVNANGAFAFADLVASGVPWAVTVEAQPAAPAQTCAVAGGSGTMAGAAAATARVTCLTNRYPVGGTVSGLAGAGLALQVNGGDEIAVAADGTFAFPALLEAGQGFEVAVAAQPAAPAQHCTVAGGRGTVVADPVASVAVTCATDLFAVGGNVSGLLGSGLELRQGGGDALAVGALGGFAFATPVASGAPYAVTVSAQPTSPWQTCTVARGSGTVASQPVADVAVTCATDTFAVGGAVSGLAGSGLVLRNGADVLAVAGDGPFALPAVASGSTYLVTVAHQPAGPSQTCQVAGATGAVAGAAVSGVAVTCTTDRFTLGGTASGMPPAGLSIADGLETLTLDFDGPWAFPTPRPSGAAYAVSVVAQPDTLACTVSGGSGTVGAAPVSAVAVSCACRSGLLDCDGNPGNGCEIDVRADAVNCGACGHVCAGGTICVDQACVTPTL